METASSASAEGKDPWGTAPAHVQRGRLVLVAYNAFYWPYLIGTVVLYFGPALLVFILTFLWDGRRRLLHAYSCIWGGHYLAWAPLAGVEVRNRERGELSTGCIYVSNHQSMVDILAVYATRFSFLWVSKVENFYVPFLGWNMLMSRYIGIKRGYLPSIMRMVRTCNRRLRDGENLFIFPEGTRSPDGRLIPFYSGAFRLAVRNRVPIVPLVLEGTNRILAKHSFHIDPQRCVVQVLEPIYPESVGYDHRRLHDAVRSAMQAAQDDLRGERAFRATT
jgi:1-acyl-sn-glycerol-3-phosphate acyltransferase